MFLIKSLEKCIIRFVKDVTKITPVKSYLLGLITGRGHFFIDSKSVAIEFSHINEIVWGIAHCPVCGWLATDNNKGSLKCKNPSCGSLVDPAVKKAYNQPQSTIDSIRDVIVPYLKTEITADYQITGNKSMTILVLNFKDNQLEFSELLSYFSPDISFDRFHIPKDIALLTLESKCEFINGLLDTSGFANAGGWLNRDGKNGHGRMRVYFQIVRNWHLPVEIDNFLRSEFQLPVHTIDWGHPNIRDGNLNDFYETNPTSWGREHQIKFFPEYYHQFKFRISSKQLMFEELKTHNINVGFDNKDDWFPPLKITKGKLKAYHPGENDLRIPEPARKHFDAFWQVNLAMGCKYLTELKNNSKNPELFMITGETDLGADINNIQEEFDLIRHGLTEQATNKTRVKKSVSTRKVTEKEMTEQATYAPLAIFFSEYLSKKYKESVEAFDTSAGNLNLFLKNRNKDLLEAFDYCDKFRIKPDVVGFLENKKSLGFIESKITPLDLKCLGQLLGYCFVAQPVEAILVSTKAPSASLIKVLKARPDLLIYAEGRRIQLAVLEKDVVNFIEI